MENLIKGFGNLKNVHESREIKITSKRQLTIPKAYFDYLGIEETIDALLLDDGIFIKPKKKQSIQEMDTEIILRNIMNEGYTGDELVDEFSRRLKKYNRFLESRIDGFLNDLTSDTVSEAEVEGEDFNGLDIFFDEEVGKNDETIREEK